MGQMEAWLIIAAPVVMYVLWEIYGVWLDTRPNKMKAVFFDGSRRVRVARVDLNHDGKSFNVKGTKGRKGKYHVVESAIYRTGLWRVPTSYYKWGFADPIDQLELASMSSKTADEYHEATEAHVARDIIETFSSPMITITSSMLIVIATVAIANAIVYIQLNTKLDEIMLALGIVKNGG